jgi:hypothetical protein
MRTFTRFMSRSGSLRQPSIRTREEKGRRLDDRGTGFITRSPWRRGPFTRPT